MNNKYESTSQSKRKLSSEPISSQNLQPPYDSTLQNTSDTSQETLVKLSEADAVSILPNASLHSSIVVPIKDDLLPVRNDIDEGMDGFIMQDIPDPSIYQTFEKRYREKYNNSLYRNLLHSTHDFLRNHPTYDAIPSRLVIQFCIEVIWNSSIINLPHTIIKAFDNIVDASSLLKIKELDTHLEVSKSLTEPLYAANNDATIRAKRIIELMNHGANITKDEKIFNFLAKSIEAFAKLLIDSEKAASVF